MGSQQSSNDSASVFIHLAQTHFRPGDVIRGEIQLKIKKPIKPDFLILTVVGKEKTYWETGAGKQHAEFKGRHVIFDQDLPLVTYNSAPLNPSY